MKYRSIVISGPVASGTTTAAKDVAEKLGLEYRSAGDFFRQYMLKHNIPLYDKAKIPDAIERKVDRELVEFALAKPSIVDGHYIGYLLKDKPNILKVLLNADSKVRYERAQERTHTHQETVSDIKKREKGLDEKFRKLYADENYLDPKFFDLAIDTSHKKPEEVTAEILEKFKGN